MSIAKKSYRIAKTFESEVLLELMLRYWNHPCAEDLDFRLSLLSSATDVLRSSIEGIPFHPNLKPQNMNLIAAIWYVESTSFQSERPRSAAEALARENWLRIIEKTLPSCFCDPDELV